MYAGALGDNAVERYAMFLTSLELSADITARRLALTRAKEHGLDMERVAIVTAERHQRLRLPVDVSGLRRLQDSSDKTQRALLDKR